MIKRLLLFAFLVGVFHSVSVEGQERSLQDETGREVRVPLSVKRIVSLAPSITEILFALGLNSEIAGVTDFCDHPEACLTKPKIGGFVNPSLERIVSLKPDLIIGIRDGNREETLEKLKDLGFSVYRVDPKGFDGVTKTIGNLGGITGSEEAARRIVRTMTTKKEHILSRTRSLHKPRVFFQVGDAPIVTVGKGTLTHDLIQFAGGKNITENEPMDYPLYSIEAVLKKAPEIIIMSSMDNKKDYSNLVNKWKHWRTIPAVKQNAIHVIDSNLVDRPTPRITQGLETLARMIHPEDFWDKSPSRETRN
jgi:iron complex transport system substrate-binding protein